MTSINSWNNSKWLHKYRRLVHLPLDIRPIHLIRVIGGGPVAHRVKVNLCYTQFNRYFRWIRMIGSTGPVGYFINDPDDIGSSAPIGPSGESLTPTFVDALIESFQNGFEDLDASGAGLSFSSRGPTSIADGRFRRDGRPCGTFSVNDLIVSYIHYKTYGKTSYPTIENPITGVGISNVNDMLGLLSNRYVAEAIAASLTEENFIDGSGNAGAVDSMFQVYRRANPTRFFDASGIAFPGFFQPGTRVSGAGSWQFQLLDQIEIPLQITFSHAIKHYSNKQPMAKTNVIEAGETIAIKLEIVANECCECDCCKRCCCD